MRKITRIDPTQPGLVAYDPTSQIPFQSRIECKFLIDVFSLVDIPPWGMIMPIVGATEPLIRYFFVVETHGMPKDTVLGIRWAPHNGQNVHLLNHTLPGDEDTPTRLEIPDEWVLECEGQGVRFECEVSYPDGTTEVGHNFDFHVSKQVMTHSLSIADLQNGDFLDPAKYPDGIPVTVNPITNVEPYNRIILDWQVLGFRENSMVLLHRLLDTQTGEPGKAYEFRVPPEAYTGFSDHQYERIAVSALAVVKLAPWPTPQFTWVIGGADLPLPNEGK